MELAARKLERGDIRLEPFEDRHLEGLTAASLIDPAIFRHMPVPVATKGYRLYWDILRADQAAGRAIPHAVLRGGVVVGQSCYLNIRNRDAGVEIGSTWYVPAEQRTAVNPACKLLLIGNAFDQGAERVELKTDALNEASRGAMLKMGAQFEGVHRKHMRRADGTLRDTAWYSVIREDWPAVRAGLEERLAPSGGHESADG
ncbi:GNAT family N-acetyltransferase [Terricaulis sp.]|uniref:GNAT family N-acetyltransferase n=1 Tax=Terricaulis sp. TaxID=2768686 RepID=UPI003784AC19